jgi:hypothetical protein
MIQRGFGNKAMGHTQVKEWFRWLKERWMSVESDERSGRPYTSRKQLMIDKVHSVMLGNLKITIREHSDELGAFIWFGTVHF